MASICFFWGKFLVRCDSALIATAYCSRNVLASQLFPSAHQQCPIKVASKASIDYR
jgi:hypothetical protein